MYTLNNYILEKLRIDKNIQIKTFDKYYKKGDKCILMWSDLDIYNKSIDYAIEIIEISEINQNIIKFYEFDQFDYKKGSREFRWINYLINNDYIQLNNDDPDLINGESKLAIIFPNDVSIDILDYLKKYNYKFNIFDYINSNNVFDEYKNDLFDVRLASFRSKYIEDEISALKKLLKS